MSNVVLESVGLGFQWPTIDPFLFCVHHLDHYPAGNGTYGPQASLAGRNIGMDFEGHDGWRMYHGDSVPGFPAHPHRGFETITYVRSGLIDHSDSLGAVARFGDGDTQWLTAGAGIQHAEMFPLVHTDRPNHCEFFQIWVNLPAARKMAPPSFMMRWHDQQPLFTDGMTARVVAGSLGGQTAPVAPPDSWAADPDNEFAIFELRGQPGTAIELPAASVGVERMLYVFEGDGLVASEPLRPSSANRLRSTVRTQIIAGTDGIAALVLQSRPIAEPVAQQGPFVMNTRAELAQAFQDYRNTQFGGWPWDRPDPVHADSGRFARHPDGRVSHPGPSAA
jgi:quercetin 2,3-dioxygenase